jgi:hypothetical protein
VWAAISRGWRSTICRNWNCRANSVLHKDLHAFAAGAFNATSSVNLSGKRTQADHHRNDLARGILADRFLQAAGASIAGSRARTKAITVASNDARLVSSERILRLVMRVSKWGVSSHLLQCTLHANRRNARYSADSARQPSRTGLTTAHVLVDPANRRTAFKPVVSATVQCRPRQKWAAAINR